MSPLGRIARFARRRWDPFQGLLIRDITDMEVFEPHMLQFWKRLRYRAFLKRSFKPRDDIERVQFERQLRKLLPHPLSVAVAAFLFYAYAYPLLIVLGVLCGLTRGPLTWHVWAHEDALSRSGAVPGLTEAERQAALRAKFALEAGASGVQVQGSRASRVVQALAGCLPRRTIYVRVSESSIAPAVGILPGPALLFANEYRLSVMQVMGVLNVLNALYCRPVLLIEVNSQKVNELEVRSGMADLASTRGLCDVVYTNKDPTFTTFVLTHPSQEPNQVILLTDAVDSKSVRCLNAALADQVRQVKVVAEPLQGEM
jgi:hypothetical protein